MKLTNLIWVLTLAGVVAGCNSGPPVPGCDPPPLPGFTVNTDGLCETGGGAGGTGGTGGGGDGACTNPEDAAVYANLEFINDDGEMSTGSDAASAIASDCVFGSGNSVPTVEGCSDLAVEILGCAPTATCTDAQVAALTQCVVDCTQDVINQIAGANLSAECSACYGASVSCSAVNCATSGCASPTSTPCVQCRCDFDCTPGFDRCSGLAPSGDCS